jgi:hypothetical protein
MKFVLVMILSSLFTIVNSSDIDPSKPFSWESLSQSSSFVPENEKFIHIGGGYFAHFNAQTGIVSGQRKSSTGSIQFQLKSLGWESRFVYLPGGEFRVLLPSGRLLDLTLDKLDYVKDPRSGHTLYRLTASNNNTQAVLIADSPEKNYSGHLHLEGILMLIEDQVSVWNFRITGRNEFDAERHLNRVVDAASDFST